MGLEDNIQLIEERIKENKETLAKLDKMFYELSGPAGYPTGTSWQDYDCIRGGNKEMDLLRYITDRERLKKLIEIDTEILENLKRNLKIKEDVKLLPRNADRVLFMKSMGYTNREIAEELYLSQRHVRRIVKKYYEGDK